jgi:hypothetical protein
MLNHQISDPPFAARAESDSALALGRSLHLIDVENLLGGTAFTEADVAAVRLAYTAVAGVVEGDFEIVGSSHFTAPAVWFGWGNARRVVRSGRDGADLALIEILETENVSARFGRVVIASGDQIFAEHAARLHRQGVRVTVVTRRDSLSSQLKLATRDQRFLDPEPEIAADLAARIP